MSNATGGLSDYLSAPHNCLKIGVHSLEYDIAQIGDAVERHEGSNPGEAAVREEYGEGRFFERWRRIGEALDFYFTHRPPGPPEVFQYLPPQPRGLTRVKVEVYRRASSPSEARRMCGIIGGIALRAGNLVAGLRQIRHRGPDSWGLWTTDLAGGQSQAR